MLPCVFPAYIFATVRQALCGPWAKSFCTCIPIQEYGEMLLSLARTRPDIRESSNLPVKERRVQTVCMNAASLVYTPYRRRETMISSVVDSKTSK